MIARRSNAAAKDAAAWQDWFMLAKLPGWVRRVGPARSQRLPGHDAEEKIEFVASTCRTAVILLDWSPNRHRALTLTDPLPPSSAAALKRLRRQYRMARGRRGPA